MKDEWSFISVGIIAFSVVISFIIFSKCDTEQKKIGLEMLKVKCPVCKCELKMENE
jgi:hypothetical protein